MISIHLHVTPASGGQKLEELIAAQIRSLKQDRPEGALQVGGVREKDGGEDETESAGALPLLVEVPVPDFAQSVEENRPGESISGLAFVEPRMDSAAKLRAPQPSQNEEGPLDTPHLAQSQGKAGLPGIGGKLSKNEPSGDGTLPDGGGQAQQVFSMGFVVGEIDFYSDERLEGHDGPHLILAQKAGSRSDPGCAERTGTPEGASDRRGDP